MDRTYIESQKIVQRYLSGDLTVREAREFEKYCLENPDAVNSMPIPVRLKTKLARRPGDAVDALDETTLTSNTALEAAGLDTDDDDDEPPASAWQSSTTGLRQITLGLGIGLVAALAGIVALMYSTNAQEKEMKAALRAAKAAQLQPAGSVQRYRVAPVTAKPSAATLNVGATNPPRMIDLYVDMSNGKYNTFLVTIDDLARGRVMEIRRVARDSNGELRLSLNSSAFGAGDYDLQLEGYTWRGDTVPVGWVRLGLK